MFNGSSTFVRFSGSAAQWAGRTWWLVFIPGVIFVLTAFAIFVWPRLLAYIVAGGLMTIGILLIGWAWTMRRAMRLRAHKPDVVYYDAPQ
jgi:hypothetical protein